MPPLKSEPAAATFSSKERRGSRGKSSNESMLFFGLTVDLADVPLIMNIIPKLAKIQFEDVDTKKQVGLERKNYMVTNPIVSPEPVIVVPMEWAWGGDDVGLLNLLLMSHFGWSTQVSIYV